MKKKVKKFIRNFKKHLKISLKKMKYFQNKNKYFKITLYPKFISNQTKLA